jgi:23S rRNA pseudouridine2605 synthase
MRLNKALATLVSRRGAERLVYEGRVTLNGKTLQHPAVAVDPHKDILCVDGKRVKLAKKRYYFMLNKPAGYICTATEGPSKRVLDLFGHIPERLFTVGRLDQETTGLIIVTNDGEFANQLIHPSNDHHKEYLVKVSQEISDDHLKNLSNGTFIQGTTVKPISVKKVRRGTLKIVVSEGKKHEIRELVARCQLELLELKRIRVGPFVLGTLPIGSYRELSLQELAPFHITID